MKIYKKIEDIQGEFVNPCVTIGNFDGVHLGHQRLFDGVRQKAAEGRGTSVAITFDPHPLQVLKPGGIKLISTIEQKIELIELAGIDVLIIIPFDLAFAKTKAEDFVDEVLLGRIGVTDLFVGYDYAFGKGREGNIEFLRGQGEEKGFSVTVIEAYYKDHVLVSSTKIRELILQGRMAETATLLGRYYQIRGEVQRGKQRGGPQIGYPTANLHIDEEDLVPRRGVYVCQVVCEGERYGGVINIGYNPTFGEQTLVAETHIFDFDRNIYGKPIRINLIKFLRGEEKFAGVPQLITQIAKDVDAAREVLVGAASQNDHLLW